MAKTIKPTDSQQVTTHIQKLNPEIGEMVEYIRQFILKINPLISERIKWNNPSFYFTGPIQLFDPKEYKREIAVFNLFKGRVMLVFPSGGKLKNIQGVLTGDYSDGRRLVVFEDMADVKSKQEALKYCIDEWLNLAE